MSHFTSGSGEKWLFLLNYVNTYFSDVGASINTGLQNGVQALEKARGIYQAMGVRGGITITTK